jgi:hypothetical protein
MKVRKAWFLVAIFSVIGAPAALAATPKCAPGASCIETRSFTATVSSLRTSKQGANRVVTATVHFENKTAKPLTLGYVSESGLALDELGNRYLVPGPNAVRAIGEISGTNFDPKFTLPPGEGSDAKFELTWDAGKNKAGVSFELDLAIRELTPTGTDQFKLGQEHAVHFASLGQAAATGGTVAGAAASAPAPKSTDPCGGSSRCFNAGTFIAEVMQVTPTAMTKGVRHHSVSFNIRFRNISDKPLILGYQASSSAAVDNFGNGFTWGRPGTYDTSVKGIGIVSARSADTQFSLAPNQARSATFNIIRYEARPPIGESWNYNVIIADVEIQPGQVVKAVRQNSVSFERLAPGSFAGASVAGGSAAGSAAAALNDAGVPTDADAAVGKMIDLINRKTKKK